MLGRAMYTTIQTLWQKGHNKSEIARLTGHDWKTVKNVIHCLQSGKSEREKKRHPSMLDTHQERVMEWIEQGLTAVRIHEELLSQGVKAGYTTVKTYVAKIKGSGKIFIRIHTLPGEEAQVDFGYVGYRVLGHNGTRSVVENLVH